MKIYLLRAEHFSQAGLIAKAYSTRAKANAEAVELTAILLKDSGSKSKATLSNWESHVAALQDEHGAQYCYVEIDELAVDGA